MVCVCLPPVQLGYNNKPFCNAAKKQILCESKRRATADINLFDADGCCCGTGGAIDRRA